MKSLSTGPLDCSSCARPRKTDAGVRITNNRKTVVETQVTVTQLNVNYNTYPFASVERTCKRPLLRASQEILVDGTNPMVVVIVKIHRPSAVQQGRVVFPVGDDDMVSVICFWKN